MEKQAHKVKSADRVFDILELFTGEQESYSVTDIATKLQMPASSAYMLVQNMLERGYLETDRSGKQFRMGYKIFEIRTRYMRNTSLISEFYRVAERIVDDVNEAVFLGIRGGSQLIYIAEKLVAAPLRFTSQFTKTLPLYASASGKILLGNCSEQEIRDLYESEPLKSLTPRTIATVDELVKQVDAARKEGVAYNLGETVGDVHCIAGPIYDPEGVIVASMSVSIPTIRISEDLWARAKEWIRQGCRELSYKVYCQN
ncbi:IclR family transcriptional regulator [Paenibacillus flagellatus]|uniref:IclR family transcriptional regulator n=1 Tax=Paenibacillus flagellatus TaxID=2211139 RepID=A0A2V5KPS3_9BACL|nr:IclR family transcriptional regulator [Paenibacillus flagellatus]PYI57540.1 IclR family transcriptional regulator [Paenibacillus flagellatus]